MADSMFGGGAGSGTTRKIQVEVELVPNTQKMGTAFQQVGRDAEQMQRTIRSQQMVTPQGPQYGWYQERGQRGYQWGWHDPPPPPKPPAQAPPPPGMMGRIGGAFAGAVGGTHNALRGGYDAMLGVAGPVGFYATAAAGALDLAAAVGRLADSSLSAREKITSLVDSVPIFGSMISGVMGRSFDLMERLEMGSKGYDVAVQKIKFGHLNSARDAIRFDTFRKTDELTGTFENYQAGARITGEMAGGANQWLYRKPGDARLDNSMGYGLDQSNEWDNQLRAARYTQERAGMTLEIERDKQRRNLADLPGYERAAALADAKSLDSLGRMKQLESAAKTGQNWMGRNIDGLAPTGLVGIGVHAVNNLGAFRGDPTINRRLGAAVSDTNRDADEALRRQELLQQKLNEAQRQGLTLAEAEHRLRVANIDYMKTELNIAKDKLALVRSSNRSFGNMDPIEQQDVLNAVKRIQGGIPYGRLSPEERQSLNSNPLTARFASEYAEKEGAASPIVQDLYQRMKVEDEAQLKKNVGDIQGKLTTEITWDDEFMAKSLERAFDKFRIQLERVFQKIGDVKTRKVEGQQGAALIPSG